MQPKERQSPPMVCAFDFDGTLTVRDSFAAFLAWRAGPLRYGFGLLRLLPQLLVYVVRRDRGRLKAAASRVFLAGLTPAQLSEAAETFAEAEAPKLLRPDAVKVWRDWQAKGATMLIVSASPEAIVAPFARRLGADKLIATRLKLDKHERVIGDLDGENCRGPEKVARIRAEMGQAASLKAAYGDTSGDREMLQMAEIQGYRVFTGKP